MSGAADMADATGAAEMAGVFMVEKVYSLRVAVYGFASGGEEWWWVEWWKWGLGVGEMVDDVARG